MELFKNIRLKIGKANPVKKGCQEEERGLLFKFQKCQEYWNCVGCFKTCGICQFKQVSSENAGY